VHGIGWHALTAAFEIFAQAAHVSTFPLSLMARMWQWLSRSLCTQS
jgi:hypothetical protein